MGRGSKSSFEDQGVVLSLWDNLNENSGQRWFKCRVFLVAMFPSKCTWPVQAGAKGNATRTLQLCWKKGSSRPSFHFTIKIYQASGNQLALLCDFRWTLNFANGLVTSLFFWGGSNRIRCFVSDCHQTYMMTRSRGSRLWWLVQLFFMCEMTNFLH